MTDSTHSDAQSEPIGWISSCCRSHRMTTLGGDGAHGAAYWTICLECGDACNAIPVYHGRETS